jgi:hypothetical protein
VFDVVAEVAVLNVPALQITQSVSSSWLVAVVAASARYVPAGHATQALDAIAVLYCPAPQTTQSAASSWCTSAVPASERYEPGRHDTHEWRAPGDAEYVPAGQTKQLLETPAVA